MRKSVVAHMRANGFRLTGGSGAHFRTGRYGLAALDHLGIAEHLRAFDSLRRLRNRSEYNAVPVDQHAASKAITHARAVVEAVRKELGE